jgi:hypothetical protein
MLLQRLQSLIQFVRTYCLNDVQVKIFSVICRYFDFVDARDSCEDGTYVVLKWPIPRDDHVIVLSANFKMETDNYFRRPLPKPPYLHELISIMQT